MKLLVTGANGFVGTAFCRAAHSPQTQIFAAVRSTNQIPQLPPQVQPIVASSLSQLASRQDVLSQVSCVVHLAARVHQMRDRASDPLQAFREINTEGTRQLAIAAAQSGVKRFVYLSSIKVNGEGNEAPYTEMSKPNPSDPYGISKWEAECALREISAQTGLEIVILRPPLIYGPAVKANFLQLLRWIDRGVPLPFGRVQNSRSLLYIGNLVHAILACTQQAAASGQTFLVSDGQPVSTPDLIQHLAAGMHQPVRLLPISPVLLNRLGQITGTAAKLDRLMGSLIVDSSKLERELNWQPPFSLQQGLVETASWYRSTHRQVD